MKECSRDELTCESKLLKHYKLMHNLLNVIIHEGIGYYRRDELLEIN
jgi:hypothetical protein